MFYLEDKPIYPRLMRNFFNIFKKSYLKYIIINELNMHKNVKKCEMEFSENHLHSQNAFFFLRKLQIKLVAYISKIK